MLPLKKTTQFNCNYYPTVSTGVRLKQVHIILQYLPSSILVCLFFNYESSNGLQMKTLFEEEKHVSDCEMQAMARFFSTF